MPIVPRRASLPLFALLLALAGCEGGAPSGTGADGTSGDTGGESSGATTAAVASCPAEVPAGSGDVRSFLRSAPIASASSGGFSEPTGGELIQFAHGVETLLRNPADTKGREEVEAVGFEVTCHTQSNGTPWLVIVDRESGRGGGTFAINLNPSREVWLEAPHGDSDSGTQEESTDTAVSIGARALLINGASRCASDTETHCSGTGGPCGSMRISDAAHDPDSFFTAIHRVLRLVHPDFLAVSLHGMTPSKGEAAVLSDGTSSPRDQSISKAVRDALNQHLPGTAKAYSCNDPGDDGRYRKLCGTTNIQGRIDNGSADSCTVGTDDASDRFLHLEQGPELRLGQHKDAVGKALGEAIPCTLASCATASR